MRIALQNKVAIGFIVAALVFVSILAVEFRYITGFQRAAAEVEHTHLVKEHLGKLLSLMKDIETGQRGYLITGQKEFLDPHETATQSIPFEIETIKTLISDNEEQKRRMRSMEELVNQKLQFQQETMRVQMEQSREAAAAMVATGAGRQLMDEIRLISAEMERDEVDLLASHMAEQQQSARLALLATTIVVVLNLIVFGFLFYLIRREIRQRERAERTLRESEVKYKQLVEHASEIIYCTDGNGLFNFINPAVGRLMGYEPDELLGRSFLYPVSPSWREEVGRFYRKQFAELIPNTYHYFQVRRKDGSEIWVAQNVQLIIEDGKIVGTQCAARDSTSRVQLEVELERARDVALESARLKSEFLANMSHEIRTPMNGIIGMASLLADTELNRDQRHFLDGISQSADALLRIINDILDFSKIEAGKLHIEAVDFDLRMVVEGVVSLFIEPAETRNLELTSIIEADVPTRLQADPSRLRQILLNLLGNAIKFTNKGEVALTVKCQEQTETDVVLRFDVRDTGIGISEAAQTRLFNAFVQADGSTTRRFGGSGLGLVISKQLVEAMGGRIEVDSRLGEGSTFWFTLKARKQAGTSGSELLMQTDLQGLRALVADDGATTREVLTKQLTAWRLQATEADSYDGALEALRDGASNGRPFDFALIGHPINGRDGIDLARAIHRDSAHEQMQLILLSTFGQRPSEKVLIEAGISALLTKPVRESQLYDCLVNVRSQLFPGTYDWPQKPPLHSGKLVSAPARPDKEAWHFISNSRLLVVEDNPINQEVARHQIEKIGYRVDVAKDGAEALDLLDRHNYAMVLMDCHLPGMDGFETTAHIRRREDDKRRVPIIAVTASATVGEKEKCLQAGMDDFLAKPYRLDELSAKIANWLPDLSQTAERNNNPPGDMPPGDVKDVADRLKELEEDYGREMVMRLVAIFIPDTEARMESLSRAILEEDFRTLEEMAHGLKSGAAQFGATEMTRLCEQLETQGELHSLGNATELMRKLEILWPKLRAHLASRQ